MSTRPLTYAVITAARDEADNIERLADCLRGQSLLPAAWIVVDDASTDGTAAVMARRAADQSWIRVTTAPRCDGRVERGGPVVRAFHEGLRHLPEPFPDIVVKVDADVSTEADYFERLVAHFAADPQLGIASGRCLERDASGEWRQRFGAGTGVWGAARAYRSTCLNEILPLEERQGWDEIDALKAVVRGWKTASLADLEFRHHRREGARDGSRTRVWTSQGGAAHFMGYRPSYVLFRSLYRMRREPAAVALVGGYGLAAIRRRPQLKDAAAVRYLRETQRIRNLGTRLREVQGREVVSRTLR